MKECLKFFASYPPDGFVSVKRDDIMNKWRVNLTDDMDELTERELASAIPSQIRKRFIQGKLVSGEDIAANTFYVELYIKGIMLCADLCGVDLVNRCNHRLQLRFNYT